MRKLCLLTLYALCSPGFAGVLEKHITPSCMVSNERNSFRLSLFVPVQMKYPQGGENQRYYKQISCSSEQNCLLVSYGASDKGMGFASLPEPLKIVRNDGAVILKSTGSEDLTITYSPSRKSVEVVDSGVPAWGTGVGIGSCVVK